RHHLHAARPGIHLQGNPGQNDRAKKRRFKSADIQEHAVGVSHPRRHCCSAHLQSRVSAQTAADWTLKFGPRCRLSDNCDNGKGYLAWPICALKEPLPACAELPESSIPPDGGPPI